MDLPGATTPLPDKPADQAEAEEELLMRLVELNKKRAAEEAQGKVSWLHPNYQAPEATQVSAEIGTEQAEAPKAVAPAEKGKATFPKAMPVQLHVLREALAERPHTVDSLAELFKRKPRKSVEDGRCRSSPWLAPSTKKEPAPGMPWGDGRIPLHLARLEIRPNCFHHLQGRD